MKERSSNSSLLSCLDWSWMMVSEPEIRKPGHWRGEEGETDQDKSHLTFKKTLVVLLCIRRIGWWNLFFWRTVLINVQKFGNYKGLLTYGGNLSAQLPPRTLTLPYILFILLEFTMRKPEEFIEPLLCATHCMFTEFANDRLRLGHTLSFQPCSGFMRWVSLFHFDRWENGYLGRFGVPHPLLHLKPLSQ